MFVSVGLRDGETLSLSDGNQTVTTTRVARVTWIVVVESEKNKTKIFVKSTDIRVRDNRHLYVFYGALRSE